jgi:hypothetical protein
MFQTINPEGFSKPSTRRDTERIGSGNMEEDRDPITVLEGDLFKLNGLHAHADDFLEKVAKWERSAQEVLEATKELEKTSRNLLKVVKKGSCL